MAVLHPGTGEEIRVVNLMTVEGMHRILTSLVTKFGVVDVLAKAREVAGGAVAGDDHCYPFSPGVIVQSPLPVSTRITVLPSPRRAPTTLRPSLRIRASS